MTGSSAVARLLSRPRGSLSGFAKAAATLALHNRSACSAHATSVPPLPVSSAQICSSATRSGTSAVSAPLFSV
eukprot:scaffold104274_cov73-Phaeocystis_antarctica.AAC.2